MHEVCVICRCDDIEHCEMERYIADIRTLAALYAQVCDSIAEQDG